MNLLSGKNLIILIILIISGCFAFAANAAFNEQINFQGKLTDSSDINVTDGDYNFEFKLWSHETSTTTETYLEWTETCTTTKVTVASGLFSHLLGSVNALPDDIFNQTLWLEVAVGGTTTEPVWETLSPRKKLGAVPAAFEAKRLEGYSTSSFAFLSENETINGAWTFNNIISATASSSSAILTVNQTGNGNLVDFQVATSSKFVIDNSGNVATGTWQATPVALTYGGTGANSSSTARTNLGLEIGTDVQAFNTDLAAIAASTWTGAESITTLGTIATGTWNGSVILPNFGGTGTGTVFTQGSIVFAGASGVYSQNNSSFFWDNTNYRLGIGTATPGQKLTVAASLSSALNSGYFSTGNVLLSSLEGGMYFGRVGVKENIFGLSGYGDTWTAKSAATGTWNSVAMSSDGRIQTAVTQDYKIYNSTDYGNTWTWVSTSSEEALVAVAMSSDGKIQAAVATEGRIYVSHDYGINWSLEDNIRYWKSIAMSSDGRIITATVNGGKIYVSYDYGSTWTEQAEVQTWTSVAVSSDAKIQAASVAGEEVYISTDYGDSWASTSASHDWTSVAMSSDGRIITATVNGGKIYVSYDYGSTWTEQAEVQTWTSVAVSSDAKIQAATDDGGQIYVSTEYGTSTWTAKGSSGSWKSIAMSSDGKIMAAVAYDEYIYVSHASSYIPDGKLGIGTSTPSSVLDVYATTSSTILTVKQDGSGSIVDFKNATGTVFTVNNTGNTLLTGNLLPSATTAYNLGSSAYKWANIFAATTTIGNTVVIGGESISATGTLGISSAATTTLSVASGRLVLNSAGSLDLGTVATGVWQGTALTDSYIADAITISGGTIGSNNISGTLTTTATLTIGDGGDAIVINSSNWDVSNTGVFTGGTWQGSVVVPNYGGTGVANNAANTLTFSGNYGLTLTLSNTTSLTLPTSGTLSTLAGTETLSNKTLTAPKFADLGYITDPNGKEILILDTVASAVNEITLANAAAGGNPSFTATGDSANISINLVPKGASGAVLIGGGTGKLTVGTVDPVYNIQGDKYATYMSGMLGVKEETTGNVYLNNGEYVIDFNNLEPSSDLWIFYRITDFGQNWSKLTVLLSAEGPGAAWYQKDPQNNRLTIYSQTANSVSYRLTAPRFDWQKWLNVAEDGTVNGLAVDEIVNDQYYQDSTTETQVSDSSNQESGFLSEFAQKIKEALSSLGLFIENGIANIQEIVTEKLTAKKARLEKIEMVDQNTGEIYCTWIQDGEWIKEKGECSNAAIPEETPEETPAEEPGPSIEEIVPEEIPNEETPAEEPLIEETLPESQ